jgi:hypothetical protein
LQIKVHRIQNSEKKVKSLPATAGETAEEIKIKN